MLKKRSPIFVVASIVLAVAFCPACPTLGDGSTNWPAVTVELELTAADLRDAAGLVTDEDLAEQIDKLADALDVASSAISAGGVAPASAVEALLSMADELVALLEEKDQPNAKAIVVVARAAIRRIVAKIPAATAEPVTPATESLEAPE